MINYALSFVAVVKAAGFTQAARQTGISKAKLSRHVKELETLLGIQLLHRTTRTFALTEQGKQFFDSCQNNTGHFEVFGDQNIDSGLKNFYEDKNLNFRVLDLVREPAIAVSEKYLVLYRVSSIQTLPVDGRS